MFSEKIKFIFTTLSCNNSEIARAAGCSRSYISHLLNEDRGLSPGSRAVTRLVDGIYRFAEEEDLLETLSLLVNLPAEKGAGAPGSMAAKERAAQVKAALTAWIFDEKDDLPPSPTGTPKRRKGNVGMSRQKEFGDRLDEAMQVLDLSNTRLARAINVDDSLVSRWRNGLRSCHGNKELSLALVQALLRRAQNIGNMGGLAKLTGVSAEILSGKQGAEFVQTWLLGKETDSIVPVMDKLLEAISDLTHVPDAVVPAPQLFSKIRPRERYWKVEGLRQAVVRFLAEAMEQGGELWLYSDESMEWLSGDASFFAGWKALMAGCIRAGVKIRIIHNVDRSMEEMLSAIVGWLPLYMSGQIEPYVCRKAFDMRFSHTFFLRPGAACIYGFGVNDSPDKWYDYITDIKRLSPLQTEYEALLSACEPLGKIYAQAGEGALFSRHHVAEEKNISSVLSGFSLSSLPEKALADLTERSTLSDDEKKNIAPVAEKRRLELVRCLSGQAKICEMVTLPTDDMLFGGKWALNLSMEMMDENLYYTAESFAEHVRNVLHLLEKEETYHIIILPELPFPDIQIVLTDKNVTVIRSAAPCVAFSFTNPYMVHAFEAYFDILKKRGVSNRDEVCRLLRRYL